MGHANRKTLVRQVQETLESKLSIGHSRHEAKKAGTDQEQIFSWNSFQTYMKHACYFVKWCKENHGCRAVFICLRTRSRWSGAAWPNYTESLVKTL